jgi:hypothetical protein
MQIVEFNSQNAHTVELSPQVKGSYLLSNQSIAIHSLGIVPPREFVQILCYVNTEADKDLAEMQRTANDYVKLYGNLGNEYYASYFRSTLLVTHVTMHPYLLAWQCFVYPHKIVKGLIVENTARLMGILFQDGNYSITHPLKSVSELFQKPIFMGMDLKSFTENAIVPLLRDDANGFLAVVPSGVNEYRVVYLASKNLTHQAGDFYRFEVKRNGITTEYLFDSNNTLITDFEMVRHNLGRPAVMQLGGTVVNREDYQYYESFWAKAASNLDSLVRHCLDAEIIRKQHTHPIRQAIELACTTCDGTGHVRKEQDGTPCAPKECYVCKGKQTIKFDPSRNISVPIDELQRIGGNLDLIKHYAPETVSKESAFNAYQLIYQQVKDDLNLLVIDAAQSGTAKAIDLEARNTVISQIKNRVFYLLKWATDTIAYLTYGAAPATVVIPSQYLELITPAKLQTEYLSLKVAGADTQMIERVRRQWFEVVSKTDAVAYKTNKILELAAPLRDYSLTDLLNLVNSEAVKQSDFLSAIYAFSAINQYIEDKGTDVFLSAKNSDILAFIEDYIERKTPADAMNDFGSDGLEGIENLDE